MSIGLQIFTLVHVAISLIAIVAGFVVVQGLISSKPLNGATATFLAFTALTSITGDGELVNSGELNSWPP